MKKLLILIALILAFASSVNATDVTVASTTIANFNPSGIGSDRTYTVTTSSSTSVTCSACLPSVTVGLGGFQVLIGSQQYTVATVVSTSALTLTSATAVSGSQSMTFYKYVLLRIYADRAFQPAGASYIVQPGVPGSQAWYKQVAASIINNGSANSLWIPSLTIDATTDATGPTNQAKYTWGFYRPDGALVQLYGCFEQMAVPPITPTTHTALCAYNAPPAIVPPANEAYTKTQIDARFPSCTSGQMLYYAATGNIQSCLTVGSGLTIASGTITASGGGGGGSVGPGTVGYLPKFATSTTINDSIAQQISGTPNYIAVTGGINASSSMSIGATAPSAKIPLNIGITQSSGTGPFYGIYNSLSATTFGSNSETFVGSYNILNISGGGPYSGTTHAGWNTLSTGASIDTGAALKLTTSIGGSTGSNGIQGLTVGGSYTGGTHTGGYSGVYITPPSFSGGTTVQSGYGLLIGSPSNITDYSSDYYSISAIGGNAKFTKNFSSDYFGLGAGMPLRFYNPLETKYAQFLLNGSPGANYTYYLPTSTPSLSKVLQVAGVSGTNITLDWASGGSSSNIRQALNIVSDYGCDPTGVAVADTCFGNALTAAALSDGKIVYAPAGTYLLNATATIPGGVTVVGDGRNKTLFSGTVTSAPIFNLVQGSGAYVFQGPTLRDLRVVGNGGSGQIGINVDDATYVYGVEITNVDITGTGSHGLYIGNAFSSRFININSGSSTSGYPFYIYSANMPGNYFESLYAGNVNVTSPAGFRIRRGRVYCVSCNGINTSSSNSWWAIVGDKVGVDGSVAAQSAYFQCTNCNVESSRAGGILSYSNSPIDLFGQTTFAGDGGSSGTYKAVSYDIDLTLNPFPAFTGTGTFSPTVSFQNSPASFYANSEPIHSTDIPPLIVEGTGPQIAGSAGFGATFYNSTTARSEKLRRADGAAPVTTITATTSFTQPGPRYFETNCAANCTLTLPWSGWYPNGEYVTIRNTSADGIVVTIASGGGGSVNGGTLAISKQNQGYTLYANNSASDWRVVSNRAYVPNTYVAVGDSNSNVSGSSALTWDTTTLLATKAGSNPSVRVTDSTNSITTRFGPLAGAPDRGIVGTTTNHPFVLYQNGGEAWGLNTSKHFIPYATSNTLDLGGSTTRARTGYFGTSLDIGVSSATTGGITLRNSTNANTFTIQAGVTGANLTYTLPTAYSTGTQCLADNGSGTLSWVTCAGGSGLTSLNALTASTQTFAKVDDTNVTLTIGSVTSTHTFTLGWTGTLAKARQNSATVYNDAGNTWSTGAQDFGAATSLKVPTSAGAAPTASGLIAYDSTSDTLEFGSNTNNRTIATTSNNLGAFSATTSAQLAGVISDETGSGLAVFATSPTLTTPTLGVASATSINKVALTAPATSATLTIADGKTLTASNTLTFTGVDTSSVAFGSGGTVTYTANNLSVFAATTSAQLAGVLSDETGSGSAVFGTSPTISGGTHTALTSLGIRSTGTGAFDLTLANSENLTLGRTLTLKVNDAARTIDLAGNLTLAAAFSTSGANALTLTTTGSTNVTLPTTGTLAVTGSPLSQFAATTSAQLAGVLSDETGTGVVVFGTSPTLTTPTIGSFANSAHNHTNAAGGGQLTDAALSAAVTVAKGGTGITTGTSGGIPYFSSTSTIASSAALTANAPVIGGGAGVSPTVGTRTGNTTTFVTATGTLTSGNCAQWDANGNLVQASGACGVAGSGYGTIQEEGSNLTARATLNFVGSSATAADDAGNSRTNVTFDSDLNALASNASTGLWAVTGAGTGSVRTITGTTNVITVTNGDGVAGNPTLTVGSLVVRTDQGNTWTTGAQDMGAATSLKVPTSAGAAPTASGLIAYDSTSGTLEFGDNTNNRIVATTSNNLSVFAATTSAQLAGVLSDETGSGSAVFGTAPTISGGTHTALTSLGIRSTGTGAFDLTLANSENLTAGRTLTLTLNNTDRTINLGGNLTLASSFTTSGANALTLTTTGSTNVTLPTTGTLAVTGSPLSQFAATTSAQLAGVLSDETGSGVVVFGTTPTLTTPVISGAVSFPANTRQTFAPGATVAGLNVGSIAGDPSTPVNGDVWYDSTGNALRARINSATVSLGAGGGGTPGGSNTELQRNNAGVFGGITGATSNGTSVTFTSGNLVATTPTITTSLTTGSSSFDLINTTATNVNFAGAATTMSIGASGGTITSPGNIAFATGQAIRTGVGGSNSLLVQAYDTDGFAYTTFFTLTANTTPTLSVDQPLSWADGVKQTFNPNGTNAGINLGSQAGDPSSLANGDMWYDSTSHLYRVRINSASATLATIATSQTFTNKTLSTGVAVSQPLTWGAGVRQTFSPDSITPGVNLGSFAGDPSTPSNGDMWYNSTTNKFRCYQGGAAADCITAAGGAAPGSNKQVIYNNSGTSAGATGFEYQSGSSPNVSISAQSTSHTPLNINGLTSQTAPIQTWQLNNSTRTVIGEDARSIYIGNGRTSGTGTIGVVSGTEATGANIGGSGLLLQGGAGTGTGTGGSVMFKTAPAGGAGSSLNAYVTAMEIDSKSNIEIGSGAATTTSTEGFVYIQSVAGLPTGVPGTAYSGTTPTLIDSTNKGFCMYVSGWSCVRPVGGTTSQVLYNNGGYAAGIAGAASNGTTMTFASASLIATSPAISTSITTSSSTFALVNTNATTVNFAGAATTLNIGASAATVLNFGGSTTAAEFRFLEPSGSGTNYSAFKAGAQGANITYTLPGTVAAVDGDVLSSNTSGTLSWITPTPATPPGTIVAYAGATAPTGWLLCDGSAVTRTGANTALFAIVGTSYGPGDGSSTFNLPDLRQRFAMGKAASGTGATLGGTGGAIDHTHTSAAHTHGVGTLATGTPSSTDSVSTGADKFPGGETHNHTITGSTASTTPGATGTNNPPYVVVNYIIKQ